MKMTRINLCCKVISGCWSGGRGRGGGGGGVTLPWGKVSTLYNILFVCFINIESYMSAHVFIEFIKRVGGKR